MLRKISTSQAKHLFERGRIVYAVAAGENGEDLSVARIRMEKTRQSWRWPEESITRFKTVWKTKTVDFYCTPENVMAKRNGTHGFILSFLQRKGQLMYRGTDRGLIRFLNQNILHLENSGYLDASYRGNLQY